MKNGQNKCVDAEKPAGSRVLLTPPRKFFRPRPALERKIVETTFQEGSSGKLLFLLVSVKSKWRANENSHQ